MDGKENALERRNLIERYLNGALSAEELQAFEQRMKENRLFAEEIYAHRDVISGIDYYFRLELKRKLVEEEENLLRPAVTTQQMLGIAASVALLLVAVYLFKGNSINPESTFKAYFSPYPANFAMAVMVNDSAMKGSSAMKLYEKGSYEDALYAFDIQVEQSKNYEAPLFYSAVTLLKLKRIKDANSRLKLLINRESSYSEAARWYLALSYLRSGRFEVCEKLLQQVASSKSNEYHDKAHRLLQEL
jgi:hypothetical protein